MKWLTTSRLDGSYRCCSVAIFCGLRKRVCLGDLRVISYNANRDDPRTIAVKSSALRALRYLPYVAVLLIFVCGFIYIGLAEKPLVKAGCTVETLSKSKSPNGKWLASVHEYTCTDGWFVTDISDAVRLVQLQDGRQKNVFSVDSAGDPSARPVPRWIYPNILDIDVPNKSLIGVQEKKFAGVTIEVKFHPNDPKARARWLKSIGQARKNDQGRMAINRSR